MSLIKQSQSNFYPKGFSLGDLVHFRKQLSHIGTLTKCTKRIYQLTTSYLHSNFTNGILCVIRLLPIFKRKIEMEKFEDNYNILQTYLYVSYLDTLNEMNNLELSEQKEMFIKQLCNHSSFNNNLL